MVSKQERLRGEAEMEKEKCGCQSAGGYNGSAPHDSSQCKYPETARELVAIQNKMQRALDRTDGADYREEHLRANTTPDELRDIVLGLSLRIDDYQSHAWPNECDRCKPLEAGLAQVKKALRLRRDELRALRHTIVATIGGTDDEGNPTSEINYLQRLRRLVAMENELAQVRKERDALKALIDKTSWRQR